MHKILHSPCNFVHRKINVMMSADLNRMKDEGWDMDAWHCIVEPSSYCTR